MPVATDLRFEFSIQASGVAFDVVAFSLEEALSENFRLTVDLSSFEAAVDFSLVLDQPALFTLWQGGQAVRHVHGLVSTFEQGTTGFRRTRYRAMVEPALARAALCSDWRIFQQQSVPEILATVIKSHGITNYEQVTTKTHLPREYCVQAGDTDLAFLDRLAAEEGYFYRYAHDAHGHRLIHGDRIYIHGEIAGGPVIYHPVPGGDPAAPGLRRADRATLIPITSPTPGQKPPFNPFGIRLMPQNSSNDEPDPIFVARMHEAKKARQPAVPTRFVDPEQVARDKQLLDDFLASWPGVDSTGLEEK